MATKAAAGDYAHVTLYRNGGTRRVHILVLEAFIGPKPPRVTGRIEGNHKDGDKTNNRADNLEWVTRSENALHAISHGLQPHANGERWWRSKLTDSTARAILASSERQVALAKRYGVHQSTISDLQRGRTWKHLHP